MAATSVGIYTGVDGRALTIDAPDAPPGFAYLNRAVMALVHGGDAYQLVEGASAHYIATQGKTAFDAAVTSTVHYRLPLPPAATAKPAP